MLRKIRVMSKTKIIVQINTDDGPGMIQKMNYLGYQSFENAVKVAILDILPDAIKGKLITEEEVAKIEK